MSVVIPAHDAADTLAETVASLSAQTHGSWEAVVVDDGSTDDTFAVASALAEHETRLRVVSGAHGGVSSARNAGIAATRNPWLLFLDADDLLTPVALERLLAPLVANPALEMIYGGWLRLLPDGRTTDETWQVPPAELFAVFARTCGFAIHACLVRRSLVDAVGGFDETLVTCEDWDLWQRLARVEARAHQLPDRLAIYRLRARSASNSPRRLVTDGFRVIGRGHGPDARVAANGSLAQGADPREAGAARIGLAAFGIGLAIGQGSSPDELFDLIEDRRVPGLDLRDTGKIVAGAAALARGRAIGDWIDFEPELWATARDAFDSFEQLLEAPHGAERAQRGLEDAVLAAARCPAQTLVGTTYVVEVEATEPIDAIAIPPAATRIACSVRCAGEPVGSLTLPASGATLSPWLLADAIAEDFAWDLLRRYFVCRCSTPQGLDGGALERWFDEAGWLLFLRELWDRPDSDVEAFYALDAESDGADPEGAASAPCQEPIEVASPLPALSPRYGERTIALGGTPLMRLRMPPGTDPTPQALRAAITAHGGFELCVSVVREALVGRPLDGPSLRERLAANAPAGPPSAAVRIGRSATSEVGGPAARRGALPPSIADALGEARVADVQPTEPPATVSGAIYDPALGQLPLGCSPALEHELWLPAGSRPEDFEALFAEDTDPWDYGHPYEQAKQDLALELLPPSRRSKVLELACAEGAFTERLAPRVGALTAVDRSTVALDRARSRCAAMPNAAFAVHDLFREPLEGCWDAIFCSEVLYYAGTWERLRFALDSIERALAPGGVLIATHADLVVDDPDSPGFDWGLPFGAVWIGRTLSQGSLKLDAEIRSNGFRVQRWRRPGSRLAEIARLRRRPLAKSVTAPAMPEEIESSYRPHGGPPTPVKEPVTASRVPVLMYHRVAERGAAATATWRVTPAQLAAQLDHLRAGGYRTIGIAELARHVVARTPLPGKPVVLTFDDAYVDFAEAAWPLIRERGFGATLFVVTDHAGGVNAWDSALGEELQLLGWDALRALRDEGVEIGSHTGSHPALSALTPAQIADEALRSRMALQRELGFAPRAMAYPFGDVDQVVRRVVATCGYEAAVTCAPRAVHLHDHALLLPRIEATAEDGAALGRRIERALAPDRPDPS